jgi:hypothetical protein
MWYLADTAVVFGDETAPPMSTYAHELVEDLEQVRVAMAKFA